ncbi:MAG: DNA-directed RNA polymerase subunit omega [bacterium]
MRYPSIDKLLVKIDSKYKLAYAASKRAKMIESGSTPTVKSKCVKPVGQALEEILDDKVKVTFVAKSHL